MLGRKICTNPLKIPPFLEHPLTQVYSQGLMIFPAQLTRTERQGVQKLISKMKVTFTVIVSKITESQMFIKYTITILYHCCQLVLCTYSVSWGDTASTSSRYVQHFYRLSCGHISSVLVDMFVNIVKLSGINFGQNYMAQLTAHA